AVGPEPSTGCHCHGTADVHSLERRLLAVSTITSCGAGRRGRPRVVGLSATTTEAAATTTATATGRLAHLGRGELQRRADLVDLELDDRALLTLAGLERALPQPALHDHAVAAVQRLGDVLGRLPPHAA